MENGEHKKNQHTYVQICPWSLYCFITLYRAEKYSTAACLNMYYFTARRQLSMP